ncbi:MAG: hypothetical protein KF760_08230 [Candidatus Eremiobacteraeota bacterium]|nr:hypothetical protein [Candidatus Eremiobacteraeota bacterium]MCW5871505.1 hypothetical protein [Candidatus Eremiobacteraeota bacterium]
MKRRGMSLGTVLIVISLLAALGLALAGGVIAEHTLLARARQRRAALNVARSLASLVIERIYHDTKLGQPGQATRPFQLTLEGDCTARLSFDDGESCNNLENPQSVVDSRGEVVPPNGVRLYSVGTCRGVRQTVTVTLVVPPFPWAVASGGKLRTDGLEIGKLDSAPDHLDNLQLQPADVVANDDVTLGPRTHISGDLQTAGQVQRSLVQPETIVVEGETRVGSNPVTIPLLQMDKFDPQRLGLASATVAPGPNHWDDPLSGAFRGQGLVRVQGDLALDGGLLYVDGDLEVSGKITGKGMVVSTGKLEVNQASQLEGSDSLALLSQGDMKLRGSNPDHSQVSGLVYSGGTFEAHSLSVLGTLVTQKDSSFQDSRLVSLPSSSQVTVQLAPPDNVLWIRLSPEGLDKWTTQSPEDPNPPSAYVSIVKYLLNGTSRYHVRIYDASGTQTYEHPRVDDLGELLGNVFPPKTGTWAVPDVPFAPVRRIKKGLLGDPAHTGSDLNPGQPGSSGPTGPTVEVDLNSVLKLEDRIRLCSWLEN